MKIHLTKKEYRLLLDMLCISEWIMNSQDTEKNEKSEPYTKLEQKLMSYAKEYGYDNLITYSSSLEGYYPTKEYEFDEQVMSFIDDFEEHSFWEKLCSRLAQRDLVEELGVLKVKEMEPLQRMTEEDKFADKYYNEFENNGVKNLRITNS